MSQDKVGGILAPLGAQPLGEPGLLYMSATAVIGGLASFPLEVLAVASVDCFTIGKVMADRQSIRRCLIS